MSRVGKIARLPEQVREQADYRLRFLILSPATLRHNLAVIEYRIGNNLDLEQVVELYRASTLGERRPIDDRERFVGMLKNANLVITAWDGATMVGIARSMTDFNYFTYLADLAVRVSHQKQGIGRELMRRTQIQGGAKTSLLLLSAPAAADYYPHVGFTRALNAWLLKPGERIP
jgi:predicted N-acetyltransferase YhbS